MGDDIGGIAVHIAARIMSQAAPGEILVSSSLRDLVVGSGIGFDDRGSHELKGVPGHWQLLAVNPSGPQPGSPEAILVSLPTPSARTAMRRSDRTVATMARRTPWLLRGLDQHLLQRVTVDGDDAADARPPFEGKLADRGPSGVHDPQRLEPEACIDHGAVEPQVTEHPLAIRVQRDARAAGPPARVPLDEVDLDPALRQCRRGCEPGYATT